MRTILRNNVFVRLKFTLIAIFFAFAASAQVTDDDVVKMGESLDMDSVEFTLVTCGAHDMVYALYGHTAIAMHDMKNHEDVLFNWGIFNRNENFFVLRFIFGLTDYQMGIQSFDSFFVNYAYNYGTSVVEQVLDLTADEKWRLLNILTENYKPENRTYRYNYFYDNCTTRARDVIESSISGDVEYRNGAAKDVTFRSMIHQWNEDFRWARYGNDLLLGVKSDLPTERRQQEFLPDSLRYDFDHAIIKDLHGNRRNLVKEVRYLSKQPELKGDRDLPSPMMMSGCILLITLSITLAEIVRHRGPKAFWWYDALLLLLSGIPGLILFCMIFSQHPTVSLNLQILILSPLSLILLWPVARALRRDKVHWYWALLAAMTAIALICGCFLQQYAEGMELLACSLLMRSVVKFIPRKK